MRCSCVIFFSLFIYISTVTGQIDDINLKGIWVWVTRIKHSLAFETLAVGSKKPNETGQYQMQTIHKIVYGVWTFQLNICDYLNLFYYCTQKRMGLWNGTHTYVQRRSNAYFFVYFVWFICSTKNCYQLWHLMSQTTVHFISYDTHSIAI